MFFVDFSREITEKALKWTKKGWKTAEKMFQPDFRCCKHLKAGWNTQQTIPGLAFIATVDLSGLKHTTILVFFLMASGGLYSIIYITIHSPY